MRSAWCSSASPRPKEEIDVSVLSNARCTSTAAHK
jgi:hypothetical protein